MNTTRKHIVDWVESRSDRIAKHIELRGDQAINYAVGEMIEQCVADILPKIKADAVLSILEPPSLAVSGDTYRSLIRRHAKKILETGNE